MHDKYLILICASVLCHKNVYSSAFLHYDKILKTANFTNEGSVDLYKVSELNLWLFPSGRLHWLNLPTPTNSITGKHPPFQDMGPGHITSKL